MQWNLGHDEARAAIDAIRGELARRNQAAVIAVADAAANWSRCCDSTRRRQFDRSRVQQGLHGGATAAAVASAG